MSKKPLNLSPAEMKEHKKALHTQNARKRREKEHIRAYLRLVETILELKTTENLSLEEIALKLAKNEQFRLIYTPKTPFQAEKPKKVAKKS